MENNEVVWMVERLKGNGFPVASFRFGKKGLELETEVVIEERRFTVSVYNRDPNPLIMVLNLEEKGINQSLGDFLNSIKYRIRVLLSVVGNGDMPNFICKKETPKSFLLEFIWSKDEVVLEGKKKEDYIKNFKFF